WRKGRATSGLPARRRARRRDRRHGGMVPDGGVALVRWSLHGGGLLIRRWAGGAPLRSSLTLAGLTLGCTAMFAMQILGASIEQSIRTSVRSVLGDAAIAVNN